MFTMNLQRHISEYIALCLFWYLATYFLTILEYKDIRKF